MKSLWISPCSLFTFVKQTLRCSVSTPVRVPTYVLPWLVTMLTCFWRRLESSSMNLRPAVEDILATFVPLSNRLYHLWSNPPRLAFASETIALASRESFAICITLNSLTGILALHFGHVLLL